jgi:hypothetical protein
MRNLPTISNAFIQENQPRTACFSTKSLTTEPRTGRFSSVLGEEHQNNKKNNIAKTTTVAA